LTGPAKGRFQLPRRRLLDQCSIHGPVSTELPASAARADRRPHREIEASSGVLTQLRTSLSYHAFSASCWRPPRVRPPWCRSATPASAATQVCVLACDTLDPSQARQETFRYRTRTLNGRRLELHVSRRSNGVAACRRLGPCHVHAAAVGVLSVPEVSCRACEGSSVVTGQYADLGGGGRGRRGRHRVANASAAASRMREGVV